jgi:hypothetical protein
MPSHPVADLNPIPSRRETTSPSAIRKSMEDCPGGTCENSPAFQRWGGKRTLLSPEGMAERRRSRAPVQPSLRDLFCGDSFPGVETPGYCRQSLRDTATSHLHMIFRKTSRSRTPTAAFAALSFCQFTAPLL